MVLYVFAVPQGTKIIFRGYSIINILRINPNAKTAILMPISMGDNTYRFAEIHSKPIHVDTNKSNEYITDNLYIMI